jgi:hypothetical protein
MYYDDEARRFNFLSGFLLGAVLGTGLALVGGRQRGRKKAGFRGVLADAAKGSEHSWAKLLATARK